MMEAFYRKAIPNYEFGVVKSFFGLSRTRELVSKE
jgi:hypothetical protein